VTSIVRNATRVLRGLFVLRLATILLGVVVYTVRWSVFPPPEPFEVPPRLGLLFLPTLVAMLFLFAPGLERRLRQSYLPIALVLVIVVFTIESSVAFIHPRATIVVNLRSGLSLNLPWAQTEAILMTLVPCVLSGAAYGLRGAIKAATLATLLHLPIGIAVWLLHGSMRGFLISLLPRVAVLYAFPVIAGYLADTWRREHTRLQQANRQLRGYAATIEQLATSRERVRLARAMHDTLAHTLAALVVQLEAVGALQETDPSAAQTQLTKVNHQARTGLQEARRAIADLRSAPIEESGLAGALEHLVTQFSRQNGIHTNWQLQGDPTPLLPVQANALYRIAEEALTNVARHADAGHVAVRLSFGEGVTLTIRDDGEGFEPQAIEPDHYGLVGIQERAALVDGTVEIVSTPSKGTTLIVHIAELWEG
jgi:signal transduction histidine kinase